MTDVAVKPQFSRSRSILSGAIVLLTCVTLLSSILALWAEHSLLDTNRFTNGVSNQLNEPVVSDALGTWVGEQVGSLIQTDTIKDVLPDRLDIVAPFLTNTLQSFASDKASEFVQSDTGKAIVVRAVRAAHTVAMKVLDGNKPDSGVVVIQDGKVMLNLIPVVYEVVKWIQDRGIATGITLPDINSSQTPSEQIALLSDAFGRELKPTFGQITVYERKAGADGSMVATAQQVLKIYKAVIWLLVALVFVFAALSIWVAPRRRRAVIWLGVGLAATGILAHLVVRRVAAAVPKLVSDPDSRAAAAAVVDGIVGRLDRTLLFLSIVAGLLVIFIAYVAFQGTAEVGQRLRAFALRSPDAVRIVAVVLGMILMLWFGIEWWTFLVALAIVVAGFVAVREAVTDEPASSGS